MPRRFSSGSFGSEIAINQRGFPFPRASWPGVAATALASCVGLHRQTLFLSLQVEASLPSSWFHFVSRNCVARDSGISCFACCAVMTTREPIR